MAKRISTGLTHSARREWTLRLILLTGSIVFGLVAVEGVVRAFFPLADGRANVDINGRPLKEWFPPGVAYRQISNEYDALTTITDKSHRVPGVTGNPEVIFLGDSFTYGYGLKDEDTFASIYCATLGRACANLGMPGSGTSRQVQRLEEFLTKWRWRPKEVKLFFFGMSTSFSSGNDFVDNYNFGRWRAAQVTGVPPQRATPSLVGRVISWQSSLLEHSYLMRRAKYHWGPMIKSTIVDGPSEERLAEAERHTAVAFKELDALAARVGFDYTVYLIVPVTDLIRHSQDDTLATLNRVSTKPVVSTAQLFVESPARFFFAYDGHLNPLGSRTLADYLVSLDRGR
jgi:hypothetical protein